MRKLSSLFLVGSLAVSMTACDEFLTPDPVTFISSADYYTEPQHFEQAVVGLYANLRGLYGGNYRTLTDFRSDLVTLQYNIGVPGFNFVIDEFTDQSTDGNVNGQWNSVFNMIFDANVVLARIEPVEFADQAQKDRLIAEARFFRALAMWQGLQFWGTGNGWDGAALGMPIITEEVTSPEQAFDIPARSTVQETWQFIIDELTAAKPALPAKSAVSSANLGRITQGAAAFLLGATYQLNTSSPAAQQAALDQFEELEGQYSLVTAGTPGNNAFRQVFNPAAKNNSESILEIQYNGGATVTHGIFQNLIGGMSPLNSAGGGNTLNVDRVSPWGNAGGGGYLPTPDHVLSFNGAEPGDTGPFDLRYEGGYGQFCPNRGVFDNPPSNAAGSPPGPEDLPALTNPVSGVLGVSDVVAANQSPNRAWPDLMIEQVIDPVSKVLRRECIAYFTKWRWENETPLSGRDNNNWIVFRYSDALLRRAEATLRAGGTGAAAAAFVNPVRVRAGLDPVASVTLDDILLERAKELAGEGHRWFDLKRFGVADVVIDAHGDFLRGRNNSAPIRARTIENDSYSLGEGDYRAKYPIRPRDITLTADNPDGGLVQNPVY